jgi:NADP-dependent 3-hydroxy acid dehydrogenase YdfG
MTLALANATALVTGASRGIGRAIARSLVGAGARTLLLARPSATLSGVVASLGDLASAVAADLIRSDEVARAVADVERACDGAPDIVVLNAGMFALGAVGRMPPEEFERLIDVNLIAPYRVAAAFVPGMRVRGTGDIVTLGSIADRVAYPENAAYAAGKFGARGMHRVLREELRGSGVRASLVSPGPVDTPMWDRINPDGRVGFTPRARMLRPEAVADAVLWVVTRPREVDIEELRMGRT